MTGLFNGTLRFAGNYKGQWNGFTNGYRTIAAAADMRLKETKNNSIIGGGIVLYADKAGDLEFSTNSASVNFSFLQMLGQSGRTWLSVGIQNSYTQSSLDFKKIKAFEIEPNYFSNNGGFWHLSTGIAFSHEYGKDNSFHLGASLFHINSPDVSFFKNLKNHEVENLDRKLILHGGANIRLSKTARIRPNFLFSDQGPHKEITLGAMAMYRVDQGLSENNYPVKLYLGGWVRWYAEMDLAGTDAMIAAFRVDYKNTNITFSYDINLSTLTRASSAQGGMELSIVKVLTWERKKKTNYKLKCPQDYF